MGYLGHPVQRCWKLIQMVSLNFVTLREMDFSEQHCIYRNSSCIPRHYLVAVLGSISDGITDIRRVLIGWFCWRRSKCRLQWRYLRNGNLYSVSAYTLGKWGTLCSSVEWLRREGKVNGHAENTNKYTHKHIQIHPQKHTHTHTHTHTHILWTVVLRCLICKVTACR